MKKLINGNQALCLNCQTSDAVLHPNGSVRCSKCHRMMLVDKKSKELFIPRFEDDTYQASSYTPPVLEQRSREGRAYPIIKDRRKAVIHRYKRGA